MHASAAAKRQAFTIVLRVTAILVDFADLRVTVLARLSPTPERAILDVSHALVAQLDRASVFVPLVISGSDAKRLAKLPRIGFVADFESPKFSPPG
jgi:hypothetical protein